MFPFIHKNNICIKNKIIEKYKKKETAVMRSLQVITYHT